MRRTNRKIAGYRRSRLFSINKHMTVTNSENFAYVLNFPDFTRIPRNDPDPVDIVHRAAVLIIAETYEKNRV